MSKLAKKAGKFIKKGVRAIGGTGLLGPFGLVASKMLKDKKKKSAQLPPGHSALSGEDVSGINSQMGVAQQDEGVRRRRRRRGVAVNTMLGPSDDPLSY
jgi:hypothetical protein